MVGLWLTTIRPDDLTGYMRFDFGIPALAGGLSLIPVLIGLFAFSEVLQRAAFHFDAKPPDVTNVGFRLPPLSEFAIRIPQFLRSSIIGTFIGILARHGRDRRDVHKLFRASPDLAETGQFRLGGAGWAHRI